MAVANQTQSPIRGQAYSFTGTLRISTTNAYSGLASGLTASAYKDDVLLAGSEINISKPSGGSYFRVDLTALAMTCHSLVVFVSDGVSNSVPQDFHISPKQPGEDTAAIERYLYGEWHRNATTGDMELWWDGALYATFARDDSTSEYIRDQGVFV